MSKEYPALLKRFTIRFKRLEKFGFPMIFKDLFCLKISDAYLKWNKSYGGVKNGMFYSENAKIINMRLTISVTDKKD